MVLLIYFLFVLLFSADTGKFDVHQSEAIIGLRIAGGEITRDQHLIPWQVALVETNTNKLKCGGTIVCDKYILTAGMCTI